MKKLTFAGFTLLENVVAMAVFAGLIVGGFSLLKYVGDSTVDTNNILQSELLAKNALAISENIVLNTSVVPDDYYLDWNGNKYILKSGSQYEGPINAYSEKCDPFNLELCVKKPDCENSSGIWEVNYCRKANLKAKKTTLFYRKVKIKDRKADYGLYEIEVDVCFDQCDYHTNVSKIIYKK